MCALIAAQDLYANLYSVPTVALKWTVNIGMKEYLSKEYIAKLLDAHLVDSNGAEHYAYDIIKRELMVAPGADVAPVKHGHWFLLDECANAGVYCSVCTKKVYKEHYANQKLKSKFCPNCGAIMDGEFRVL